jgi:hypothetical protein
VGWQAFVASRVQSLAWPAGVVAAVVVLRKPIGIVLGQGVRRVKAGPVEVEFDRIEAEVREELARSPELADTQAPAPVGSLGLSEELSRLAEVEPRVAVITGFGRIEERLTEMVAGPDVPLYQTFRSLVRLARQRDLISDETLAAIEGLSVAEHCPVLTEPGTA